MSFTLVLTATIDPMGMKYLLLNSPEERERQYGQSLRRILARPAPILAGVVFAENSGAELDSLRRIAAQNNPYQLPVEFISLNSNGTFSRHLGKGYGELLMLDQVVERSGLICETKKFAKLTGRLQVRNLLQILGAAPKDFAFVADLTPVTASGERGWVDSRLFLCTQAFYQIEIQGHYLEVNDEEGTVAEHVLYKRIRQSQEQRIITQLPREPWWHGYSATDGTRYDGAASILKYWPKMLRRWYRRQIGYSDKVLATIRSARRNSLDR